MKMAAFSVVSIPRKVYQLPIEIFKDNTMLYKYINFSEFCDAFYKAGREDQFTYEVKSKLTELLNEQTLVVGEVCGGLVYVV